MMAKKAAKKTPKQRAAAPKREGLRLLIVEARYYEHIADALLRGATAALDAAGAQYDRITVPGALEIPAGDRHGDRCRGAHARRLTTASWRSVA